MAKTMNWLKFERTLKRLGCQLFSPMEVQRLFGVSLTSARFLIHRYTKQAALLKLRNGLYCFAEQPPSELTIANRLYEPSCISLEFALAYYHLIPETTDIVTSTTPRPTRTLAAVGKTFEYHRIKQRAFTGYEPVKVAGETVLMAIPEKAFVDYLYFVDLKKTVLNDRLSVRTLRWSLVQSYARLFEHPSLLNRLKGMR